MTLKDIETVFYKKAGKTKLDKHALFFKTGEGAYASHDRFLGISVPETRRLVKELRHIVSLDEIDTFIKSKIHEVRLFSLIWLVDNYDRSPDKIYKLYMKNIKHVNNWDLVDVSAGKIVGPYAYHNGQDLLNRLAKSKSLWERRISIVATFYNLYQGDDSQTYKIAKQLIGDKEDLIHKAVGWLLREAGKKVSKDNLRAFLNQYKNILPRTTLRYSIEHFSASDRKFYMSRA